MKRSLLLRFGILPMALAVSGLQAQTVNFHNAANFAGVNGLDPNVAPGTEYSKLYVGQGAMTDTGNNIWNGFTLDPVAGVSISPGSEWFYGPGFPWSGNPGNPYAAYGANGTVSSSGPLFGTGGTVDGTGNPTSTLAGDANSDGTLSAITLGMNYPAHNGPIADARTVQGKPTFINSEACVVNSGNPGIGTTANPLGGFTLNNVPAGTYTLYLYGANFDNTRGASFTLTTGTGSAVNGWTACTNNPAHTAKNFVLGENYVVFTNVVPDGTGTISGTFGTVTNSLPGGLSGEGDFNGLQLTVGTHPPLDPVVTVDNTPNVEVDWAPIDGQLQSATTLAGPWTSIPAATSPFLTPLTVAPKYFRVVLNP